LTTDILVCSTLTWFYWFGRN